MFEVAQTSKKKARVAKLSGASLLRDPCRLRSRQLSPSTQNRLFRGSQTIGVKLMLNLLDPSSPRLLWMTALGYATVAKICPLVIQSEAKNPVFKCEARLYLVERFYRSTRICFSLWRYSLIPTPLCAFFRLQRLRETKLVSLTA